MRKGTQNPARIESDEYWVGTSLVHYPGWRMVGHRHDQAEIGLVTRGACRIHTGSAAQEFTCGQAYFLPGSCYHAFEADASLGLELNVVHFPYLDESLTAALLDMSVGAAPCLSDVEQTHFLSICRRLQQELAANDPFADLCCQTLITELAVLVARGFRCSAAARVDNQYRRELAPILHWMHAHAHEAIHIADVAQQASMSLSHLRRLFRRYLGMSPLDYLLNVRIQSCKTLLVTTQHPMAIIAERWGFGTVQQLSRAFKRVAGTAPSRWREAQLDLWSPPRLARAEASASDQSLQAQGA